jgi:8-oxo-dGTP pyrophosphatase MutT (NUDIX family)
MSFADRLRACAVFDPANYLNFSLDGVNVGLVRPEFAARLTSFPDVFDVSADGVRLTPHLVDPEVRTQAVETVLKGLAADGAIRGWRDERYAVTASPEGAVLMHLERAAVPAFGIWATGVHVNGYVRDGDDLLMWVGRRSPGKHTAPNKLDQMVAGGRCALHSVFETVLKESEEEAGIDAQLAGRASPVGAITYCTECPEGLRRDILYVFDLDVPPDFVPENRDGEIAEFQLWPVQRVLQTVRDSDAFKFNCALVVIDFLIRHGVIAPDDEPDYLTLIHGLHRR